MVPPSPGRRAGAVVDRRTGEGPGGEADQDDGVGESGGEDERRLPQQPPQMHNGHGHLGQHPQHQHRHTVRAVVEVLRRTFALPIMV